MAGLGLQGVLRLPIINGFGSYQVAKNIDDPATDWTLLQSNGLRNYAGVLLGSSLRYCFIELVNTSGVGTRIAPVETTVVGDVNISFLRALVVPPDGRPHRFDLYPLGGSTGILGVVFKADISPSKVGITGTPFTFGSINAGFLGNF